MKLYSIIFVNQITGEDIQRYILAKGLSDIEEEYDDIVSIQPLEYTNLEEEK